MLKITLAKSVIGNTPKNRRTVRALGLSKTGRSVLQNDTPTIRGMIHHVKHLLHVEEVEGEKTTRARRGKAVTGTPTKAKAAPASAEAEPAKAAPKKPAAKKPAAKKTTTKKENDE